MKGTLVFAIFVIVVIGVLFLFPGKEYPRIPDDQFHQSATDAAGCMECHAKGKKYAIKTTHPPKYECLKCHRRKGA